MFIYFHNTDGGMETYQITTVSDFNSLYGWMRDDCKDDDSTMVKWMLTADVGEMYEHRLGCLVRLKKHKNG